MIRARPSWLLPALIGAFVFVVYIFTFPNDIQGNGDTWLRYEMTQSMMDHQGVPYYAEHGTPTWTDKRVLLGKDHKLVTIYDPGQIVAMAPLYEVGRFVAHHVTGDYVYTPRYTSFILDDIFGAFLAVLIFLLGLQLGYSRRTSALLSLLFAFGTVAWPDAESYLEHTQVSFFLALSVLLSLIFVQGGFRKRRWIALAGLSLGIAFLTRYDTGILFPLIPLYLAAARLESSRESELPLPEKGGLLRPALSELRRPVFLRVVASDWAAYAIGVAPAIVAAAGWNYARFGSLTKTGIPPTFGEPILQGLAGLTVSPGKGLIWYTPVLLALPFVVRPFYRRHPLTTLFFGSIIAVELLLFSTVIYWHGDPAYGPRYIYPIVPYLVLPLGILIESWVLTRAWAKRSFLALVAVSLLFQVVAVVTPPYRFWYREIHAQLVTHQGFNWGYKDHHFWYFYYWDVPRSPLIVNLQDAYEITALRLFGQQQYSLGVSPIPAYEHLNLSNPIHNYEINNYNLWWLASLHPFLGVKKDAVLAGFWLIMGLALSVLLKREMTETQPAEPAAPVTALQSQPA